MRALVISNTLPGLQSESSHGIFKRMDMLIEGVAMAAQQIDMLFYVHHDFNLSDEDTIKNNLELRWKIKINLYLCKRNASIIPNNFWSRYIQPCIHFKNIPEYSETYGYQQIDALNNCLKNHPDFIFVHRLRSMIPALLTDQELPPIYFDMDDIEHIAFERNIKMPPQWKSKWLYYLQIPKIKSLERQAISLAKSTFICSELDQKKLQVLCSHGNIEVIPNALAIPQPSPLSPNPTILIIGQYKYEPNRIGAEFFIDNIWPLIIESEPDAHLLIAGPSPEKIKHHQNPPKNVTFTGFVNDIDSLYKQARVVVSPILSGGGTRVKIIEAASYGKPIVSTTLGSEGLSYINDRDILIRDTPSSISETCLMLFKDTFLSEKIGLSARNLTINLYDRNMISKNIFELINRNSKC